MLAHRQIPNKLSIDDLKNPYSTMFKEDDLKKSESACKKTQCSHQPHVHKSWHLMLWKIPYATIFKDDDLTKSKSDYRKNGCSHQIKFQKSWKLVLSKHPCPKKFKDADLEKSNMLHVDDCKITRSERVESWWNQKNKNLKCRRLIILNRWTCEYIYIFTYIYA